MAPANLTEFVATTTEIVESVCSDFTNPDDDFVPVMQVQSGDGKMWAFGIDPRFMQSDAAKDILAERIMAPAIIETGGVAVATVLSAWYAVIDKDDLEEGQEIPRPSELPQRKEIVMVTAISADDAVCFHAEILRDGKNPPTLGPWEEMKEAPMLQGRFFDPLRQALKESTGEPNPEFVLLMGQL
jgi:hypothetical protein